MQDFTEWYLAPEMVDLEEVLLVDSDSCEHVFTTQLLFVLIIWNLNIFKGVQDNLVGKALIWSPTVWIQYLKST